ncbi:MAG: hypothetical protein EZS28_008288 [Streblomastix strix]|uniref:Uncharacterized protein n=1 Tax=Streblomastix strix TaxID=222440 RepID=A0A5J4WN24_9EUKA|nr:MAG: hypothetical protein EZS28_008288 [Streblomastix strix]
MQSDFQPRPNTRACISCGRDDGALDLVIFNIPVEAAVSIQQVNQHMIGQYLSTRELLFGKTPAKPLSLENSEIFLLCRQCKRDMQNGMDQSARIPKAPATISKIVPLEMLTPEAIVDLYREGWIIHTPPQYTFRMCIGTGVPYLSFVSNASSFFRVSNMDFQDRYKQYIIDMDRNNANYYERDMQQRQYDQQDQDSKEEERGRRSIKQSYRDSFTQSISDIPNNALQNPLYIPGVTVLTRFMNQQSNSNQQQQISSINSLQIEPPIPSNLYQTFQGPTDTSNWAIPEWLLMGAYPDRETGLSQILSNQYQTQNEGGQLGHVKSVINSQIGSGGTDVLSLLEAGIEVFINLTDDEDFKQERERQGLLGRRHIAFDIQHQLMNSNINSESEQQQDKQLLIEEQKIILDNVGERVGNVMQVKGTLQQVFKARNEQAYGSGIKQNNKGNTKSGNIQIARPQSADNMRSMQGYNTQSSTGFSLPLQRMRQGGKRSQFLINNINNLNQNREFDQSKLRINIKHGGEYFISAIRLIRSDFIRVLRQQLEKQKLQSEEEANERKKQKQIRKLQQQMDEAAQKGKELEQQTQSQLLSGESSADKTGIDRHDDLLRAAAQRRAQYQLKKEFQKRKELEEKLKKKAESIVDSEQSKQLQGQGVNIRSDQIVIPQRIFKQNIDEMVYIEFPIKPGKIHQNDKEVTELVDFICQCIVGNQLNVEQQEEEQQDKDEDNQDEEQDDEEEQDEDDDDDEDDDEEYGNPRSGWKKKNIEKQKPAMICALVLSRLFGCTAQLALASISKFQDCRLRQNRQAYELQSNPHSSNSYQSSSYSSYGANQFPSSESHDQRMQVYRIISNWWKEQQYGKGLQGTDSSSQPQITLGAHSSLNEQAQSHLASSPMQNGKIGKVKSSAVLFYTQPVDYNQYKKKNKLIRQQDKGLSPGIWESRQGLKIKDGLYDQDDNKEERDRMRKQQLQKQQQQQQIMKKELQQQQKGSKWIAATGLGIVRLIAQDSQFYTLEQKDQLPPILQQTQPEYIPELKGKLQGRGQQKKPMILINGKPVFIPQISQQSLSSPYLDSLHRPQTSSSSSQLTNSPLVSPPLVIRRQPTKSKYSLSGGEIGVGQMARGVVLSSQLAADNVQKGNIIGTGIYPNTSFENQHRGDTTELLSGYSPQAHFVPASSVSGYQKPIATPETDKLRSGVGIGVRTPTKQQKGKQRIVQSPLSDKVAGSARQFT